MKSTMAPASSRTGHMTPIASGSESKTAATRGAAAPSSCSNWSSRTLTSRHYSGAALARAVCAPAWCGDRVPSQSLSQRAAKPPGTPVPAADGVAERVVAQFAAVAQRVLDHGDLAIEPPAFLLGVVTGDAGHGGPAAAADSGARYAIELRQDESVREEGATVNE